MEDDDNDDNDDKDKNTTTGRRRKKEEPVCLIIGFVCLHQDDRNESQGLLKENYDLNILASSLNLSGANCWIVS